MYRGGKKDTLPRAIFSKSGSFTLMSRRHKVCMPFWKGTRKRKGIQQRGGLMRRRNKKRYTTTIDGAANNRCCT